MRARRGDDVDAERCLRGGRDQALLRRVLGLHVAVFSFFLPIRETGRPRLRIQFFFGSSSPTRRRCVILACQRHGHGLGESPPTPRHAHSWLTSPAPAALFRRTLASTALAQENNDCRHPTPRLIRHPRPRAARALQRYAALLAQHPPPPPAWPGQVHGAVYAAAAQAMEEGSRGRPVRR